MIVIKRVRRLDDTVHDVTIDSEVHQEIDAEGRLLMLPALIDPDAQFNNDSWNEGAKAAIRGGVTTVFVMPGHTYQEGIDKKKEEIDRQLALAQIPLRYHLYLEVGSLEGLGRFKKKIIALKTIMKSSESDEVFRKSAQENLTLAVHISDLEALKTTLEYAENYKTDIFLQSISTLEQLNLVRKAKERDFLVVCQIDARHLEQEDLWEGIRDGTIDCIGSSGEIELLLPKLLNAYHKKKITLDKIVQLTHLNIENIFGLERNADAVLVDLNLEKKSLKGWPVYTIVQGKVFEV